MNRCISTLVALVTFLVAPLGQAGGKAENVGMVTFHLETDPAGATQKLTFTQMDDNKARYFLRTPEFMLKDIAAFCTIPSGTGEEYGLVFQLKEPAKRRLNILSIAHQGKFLLTQVNGRVVDGVWIDKQVDDGMLIVWKGITNGDIKLLDKVLPRIGAKDKAKKKKPK